MSLALQEQGTVERHLSELLRDRVLAEIEHIGDYDIVAERLNVGRAGVEALIWKREWSVEKALRVAEALGLIEKAAVETALSSILDPPGDRASGSPQS